MTAPSNYEQYLYSQISSTTTIKSTPGTLGMIFVSSASSTPTITIYDNTAASGTKIVDTFTPVSATPYPFPVGFQNGLTIAISGTVSCTVVYN